ncbi:MAG: hypothetical protein WCD17_15045 [Acinetobacter calcoaceticus]
MHSYKLKIILLLMPCAFITSFSHAGEYQDKLVQCLKSSVTEQDRKDLVQWMFFGLAENQDLASYTKISSTDLERVDRKVANIFDKIMTQSCTQAVTAVVQNEGTNALAQSFEYLGRYATESMISDPKVVQRLQNFSKYQDEEKYRKVFQQPSK